MLFNSFNFLIFFPIVVLIYFIVPKKVRYLWLLGASYYFYMSWNAKYAILIAISTIITWLSGMLIGRIKQIGWRKAVVAASVISNLGILFFFKYFNFAISSINEVLGQFDLQIIDRRFDVLLPVGISFYTFQALSYTIDVYRGEVQEEKNFFKYALFVSFFPQLVAGPIERSKNLVTQIQNIEHIAVWNYDRIINGLIMMAWGLFQKMVIADRMAIFVNEVFDHAYQYGTIELVFAAVGFAIQIYCDFAGYSTIAIGAAKVMGFDLMENFNTPYFATSIGDFWHRWHISLSTWFRDYVYIPLGGNRCSKAKKYVNIFLTFLVSGLWHGAAWTFVIWGALHGCYQIIGDVLKPVRKKINSICKVNTEAFSYELGQVLITFALTTFAWIFFRAESLKEALVYIKQMVTNWNPWVLFDKSLYTIALNETECNVLLTAVGFLVIIDLLKRVKNKNLSEFLMEQNLWFRWILVIVVIMSIVIYGIYGIQFDSAKFIYFDF
jgi:D-alanyl-lipoteichoic acid acyltransferase DltB (MBOAT superfamily)